MKRLIKYLFAGSILLLGTSCNDFFDTLPGEVEDLNKTFTTRNLTEDFLAAVYSYVPDNNDQRYVNEDNTNSASWTAGCSEAEFCWGFSGSQDLNNGVDPDNRLVKRYWKSYYRGISRASTFIENVDRCLEMDATDRKYRKAEARALRAMFYFHLMKIYGPVVVYGDRAVDFTTDDLMLPRSSMDECVDFVEKQLTMAANELPDKPRNNSDYGRITKPIALAIRSQVLLFAASPLFNGNTDYAAMKNADGKQLISQTVDQKKWEAARDAARDFINDFGSIYRLNMIDIDGKEYTSKSQILDPYLSYRETVRGDNFSNPEMIFYRINASTSGFNYEITPYHRNEDGQYKGAGSKGTTQEMVDLYFMANGLRIDDNGSNYRKSGESTDNYYDSFKTDRVFAIPGTYNQWVGREPRFYADVTFNNCPWVANQNVITTTYFDGNSGLAASGGDHTPTGYVVRKKAPLGNWNVGGNSCILIRMAEIYLNYAEAANECGEYAEAISYLNKIRFRAGIPEYGTGTDDNGFQRISLTNDKNEIRKRIQRERAIELSYEDHRYFDTRRWKVADMVTGDGWNYPTYHQGGEGGETHGLSIEKNLPDFYTVKSFEKRAFTQKHYLFPIPQVEINVNENLVQNSGWETN